MNVMCHFEEEGRKTSWQQGGNSRCRTHLGKEESRNLGIRSQPDLGFQLIDAGTDLSRG